jgi:hypothetical protein
MRICYWRAARRTIFKGLELATLLNSRQGLLEPLPKQMEAVKAMIHCAVRHFMPTYLVRMAHRYIGTFQQRPFQEPAVVLVYASLQELNSLLHR